jgi:hypothetical protein
LPFEVAPAPAPRHGKFSKCLSRTQPSRSGTGLATGHERAAGRERKRGRASVRLSCWVPTWEFSDCGDWPGLETIVDKSYLGRVGRFAPFGWAASGIDDQRILGQPKTTSRLRLRWRWET